MIEYQKRFFSTYFLIKKGDNMKMITSCEERLNESLYRFLDEDIPRTDEGMFTLYTAIVLTKFCIDFTSSLYSFRDEETIEDKMHDLIVEMEKDTREYVCQVKKFRKSYQSKDFKEWLRLMKVKYLGEKDEWTSEIKILSNKMVELLYQRIYLLES